MSEKRFFELRQDGRILSGVAMRYGDVATLPFGKERFEAGAFGDLGGSDILITVQHSRGRPLARTNGGGLVLIDSPVELRVEATLPPTTESDDTLALVKSNVLKGLSVEFEATQEKTEGTGEGSLRVVTGAILRGLSVVDSPAFPASLVVARNEDRQARSRGRGAWAHTISR